MAGVFKCWFMQAAIFRSSQQFHSSRADLKYEAFNNQFPHLSLPSNKYHLYSKRFLEHLSIKKMKGEKKKKILDIYGLEYWNSLNENQKNSHTIPNCPICCKVDIFKNLPVEADSSPKSKSEITITIPVPDSNIKGVDKVAAKTVLNIVDEQFQQIYKTNFTDVVVKVKESNLEKKKSPSEKKKYKRKIEKKVSSSKVLIKAFFTCTLNFIQDLMEIWCSFILLRYVKIFVKKKVIDCIEWESLASYMWQQEKPHLSIHIRLKKSLQALMKNLLTFKKFWTQGNFRKQLTEKRRKKHLNDTFWM